MRRLSILASLIAGFALGSLWHIPAIAALGFAPTPVLWDASSCAAGRATVTTTATDANGLSYSLVTPDVVLPIATLAQSFLNLPPTSYTVRAVVHYDTGPYAYSDAQPVTGLGDAPIPSPGPTPSPSPSPQTPSPNCTKAVTVTDASGGVWTFDASQDTVRNGNATGGRGSIYLWANSVLYVLGTDNDWYRWDGSSFIHVGPTQPSCAVITPTPTPTPSPSPSPSPSPTPVDLGPVLTALAQQTTMLGQISTALNALVPQTVTCSVTAVGSYSNGDQKLTVRCAPSGFATNQAIKILK